MRVWKYTLGGGKVALQMPQGAKLLHVGWQRNDICIWALVSPLRDLVYRNFLVAGTGHPIEDSETLEFVGTAITPDQSFVFHVFEDMS